jgi:hypothetical protein
VDRKESHTAPDLRPADKKAARPVALLNALVALPRVLHLYPANHTRVEAQLDTVERLVGETLRAEGAIRWLARDGDVYFNDDEIEDEPDLIRDFSNMLRRRGLEALVIRPGVRRDQLRRLGLFFLSRLRHGGADEFVGSRGQPVELVSAAQRGVDEHELLDAFLDRSDVRLTLAELRAMVDDNEYQSLEALLRTTLTEEDVASLPPEVLEDALERFLRRLLNLLRTEVLRSMTVEQTVAEALSESLREARERLKTPKPEIGERRNLSQQGPSPDELEKARLLLRYTLDAAPMEQVAFFIHCEYLISAPTAGMEHRFTVLRRAIKDGRYSPEAVLAGVRYIIENLPDDRRASIREFVLELAAYAGDAPTAAGMIETLRLLSPAEVRCLAERVALRPDRVAMFAALLAQPLLDSVRKALFGELARFAEAEPDAWLAWATEHPDLVAEPAVWQLLLRRSQDLLAPVVAAVLTDGAEKDRDRYLKLLAADGRQRSLRPLLAAARDERTRDLPGLAAALGAFDSSHAVAALTEAVERFEKNRDAPEDVIAATLRALSSSPADGALELLVEVAHGRRLLRPRYRPALRHAAKNILAERSGP